MNSQWRLERNRDAGGFSPPVEQDELIALAARRSRPFAPDIIGFEISLRGGAGGGFREP